MVGFLALAGIVPPAEAGVVEHRAGFHLVVRPTSQAPLGGIAGELWSRLVRLVGGNRVTIDPNGQPSGEVTDNRVTIDPNGQPAARVNPETIYPDH